MKIKVFLKVGGCLALAAAVITGAVLLDEQRAINKYKSVPLNLPNGFTCTAHTGCMKTKDNSLQSIEAAAQHGAQIVEFDLNFTAAGEPVLAHDEPKGGEVTLDEAFKKISEYDDMLVNVDVKKFDYLAKVAPMAKKYGLLDRIFYTGIGEENIEKVKKFSPEVKYYLNMRLEKNTDSEYLGSLVQKVKNSGAVGINFDKKTASKELVDAFHANGLLVSIYTAKNERDIYRLLSYSPDNITTRRPDLLAEAVSENKA